MVAIYLLITAASFIAISVTVSYIMEDFLVSQRVKEQSEETARLGLEIAPAIAESDAAKINGLIAQRARSMGGRVLFLDIDAVVQVDSASSANGFRLPYREVRDILVGQKETSYAFHRIIRTSPEGGENLLSLTNSERVWAVYYTAPVTLEGEYLGVLLFSALVQDVEDSVYFVIRQISIVFAIVIIIIFIVTFGLSGWLTKPVIELTNAIRRMGTRGYGVRVNVRGQGELAELGQAFNRMSEQIESYDRLRDEFISNASHELKTPLSTMKVLSESMLYQDSADPSVMREFFLDVSHEIDRLNVIINDLLRLVQEDIAETELVKTPVRLDKLVSAVASRLSPLAQKKHIALETKLTEVELLADAARLEQVVVNLIDNAIKYTDEGSVSVFVRQEANKALFIVKDTGIGIPKEAQPRLFERFYRVDKARARGKGGTGLGLSIVEKIVSKHGGYIQIESAPGKGSTFTVYLPIDGAGTA
ncbi:MAG: Signal-transduction histidine kinase senX3 [Firmicutes bacterium ADurb.Bin182]|nr:MAG: Signal-transduction histidine kinase senX3 [Firmicutes bacterium ADurb.Bin182]